MRFGAIPGISPRAKLVHAWGIAVTAFAFWTVKVAATTISLGIAAHGQDQRMEALAHVPDGARLVTLVGQTCDWRVSIPMVGGVESLNASVAASVALYEITQQRGQASAE